MFGYMGFGMNSPLILFLIFGTFIWSLLAQWRVKSAYGKYAKIRNQRGMTGHDVARYILDRNNLQGVRLEQASGTLSDHYDPKVNVIRLSPEVYSGNSIASASIAAHEVGHAIQYAENYSIIGLRNLLLPTVVASSKFVNIVFIAGLFIAAQRSAFGGILMDLSILFFFAIVLFQGLTLPIEFDASKRAKIQLSELGLIYDNESEGVKKMLGAAAMTYVAALAVTLAQLIRMVLIRNRYRD